MKNINRETTAKIIVADAKAKTFEESEIRIPYTRSYPKATVICREILNLEPTVMLSVADLIQDEIKPIRYNAQDLRERARADFDSEETALEECKKNELVVPFDLFLYTAQVWATDGENYETLGVGYESTVKHTKVDARAFIKMTYDKRNEPYSVIAVHNDKRQDLKRYAVISETELKKVKVIEK